ncbi:MAG: hypothetical protein R3Y11_01340 [Pseudomonadota bacterium]
MVTIAAPNYTFAKDQNLVKLEKQVEALQEQRAELDKQIDLLNKEINKLKGEGRSIDKPMTDMFFSKPQ